MAGYDPAAEYTLYVFCNRKQRRMNSSMTVKLKQVVLPPLVRSFLFVVLVQLFDLTSQKRQSLVCNI